MQRCHRHFGFERAQQVKEGAEPLHAVELKPHFTEETEALLDQLDDVGYVIIPEFYGPEKIAEIRALDKNEILKRLVTDVSKLTSLPPGSIEKNEPLVTMMDSLTLSQFKGLLESSYAVTLSDEYLFQESTTLKKLADVVKLGYAPDDTGGGDGSARPTATAAAPGEAGGLAGALGCPPGVRCVIL